MKAKISKEINGKRRSFVVPNMLYIKGSPCRWGIFVGRPDEIDVPLLENEIAKLSFANPNETHLDDAIVIELEDLRK